MTNETFSKRCRAWATGPYGRRRGAASEVSHPAGKKASMVESGGGRWHQPSQQLARNTSSPADIVCPFMHTTIYEAIRAANIIHPPV